MTTALSLYRTTIGKKVVMALSGFVLVGFVIAHMVGNLKIFQGPKKFNSYAVFLREVGGPIFGNEQLLWVVRLVLLASVVLHIVAAVQLTRLNWGSRSQRYAYPRKKSRDTSYASRTLRWGGVIITLFIVYHILHFTTGTVHSSYIHGDVYHNVVSGFQVWYVAAFYIAAMLALGLHLYHGVWSMFQTLGLNFGRRNRVFQGVSIITAAAVVLGNIAVPVAVLAGLVH